MSKNPILRWAGSKRSALRYLENYWDPRFGRYIEPFCGSAALFFKVEPNSAILSDLNSDLIQFYKHCRTRRRAVWNIATAIPFEERTYYNIRQEYNEIVPSVRKSALFYYLNRACFNGIYRTNKSGGFNVPFSGKKILGFPEYSDFENRCNSLNSVEFLSLDFEKLIIENVKKNDFVFMDPPYATSKKRTFAEYDKGSFEGSDLERLMNCMELIDNRGGKFVCTYDATELDKFQRIERWYDADFEVMRNIGGFQSTRKKAKEIIFSNVRGQHCIAS